MLGLQLGKFVSFWLVRARPPGPKLGFTCVKAASSINDYADILSQWLGQQFACSFGPNHVPGEHLQVRNSFSRKAMGRGRRDSCNLGQPFWAVKALVWASVTSIMTAYVPIISGLEALLLSVPSTLNLKPYTLNHKT